MESLDKKYDKAFVEKLLPQKFPFVMVDTLYSFTEVTLVSGFKILDDNIFYNNDFLLESGLIEHMAQTIALHTGYEFYLKNLEAPTGYIGAIKEIEILKLPRLHDEIQTTATVIQKFGDITLVDLVTSINAEIIAKGQMKTILAQ
jgi:predicted hotdog family 3-hydroxylacyl-ACP dehydratase